MTVREKCEELISQWLGSDAAKQSAMRPQLVSDLVSLLEPTQTTPEKRPDGSRPTHQERVA